jgi:hypothetical protein
MLEAAFYDEYTDVKFFDIIYEKRYEVEEEKRLKKLKYQKTCSR